MRSQEARVGADAQNDGPGTPRILTAAPPGSVSDTVYVPGCYLVHWHYARAQIGQFSGQTKVVLNTPSVSVDRRFAPNGNSSSH